MGTNIPLVYQNTTRNMLKISLHICPRCSSQPEQEILAIETKVMVQTSTGKQEREVEDEKRH